jgi:hypothetical protein
VRAELADQAPHSRSPTRTHADVSVLAGRGNSSLRQSSFWRCIVSGPAAGCWTLLQSDPSLTAGRSVQHPVGAPDWGERGKGLRMRCSECGAANAETAQYCIQCGAPVAKQRPVAESAVVGSGGVMTRQQAPWNDQAILQDAPPAQRAWSSNSHRRALVLAGVGLVVLAAVIVAIVSRPSSVSPTRRLTGKQLRPGYCVRGSNLGLDTNGPWPREVTVVPCTQQHLAEVFFAGSVWPQSLAYPGDNEVDRQANNRCDTALDAYVGRADYWVKFTDRAIVPGSTAWSSGDRLVICIAYKADYESANYSIRGSNG